MEYNKSGAIDMDDSTVFLTLDKATILSHNEKDSIVAF